MCQKLFFHFIVNFSATIQGKHYFHPTGKGIRVRDIEDPYLVSRRLAIEILKV